MPFIWNPSPNPPSVDLPVPVPPGELTYEVRVVANAVNAGGEVLYNTPNVGFDIVYELGSLNVRNLQITSLNAGTLTINTASITTASINRATLNTANFANVFIQYGFMGSDPTTNLQIATKGYADAAAANVPAGGSDLQNIIDAKGDLLVGIVANTATRLPVGANGQVLVSDSTTTTGLRWSTLTGSTSFSRLWIKTHHNPDLLRHVVLLMSADEIVMQDGARSNGWSNLVADIRVSGAGGLDTGLEGASHWYEVYAIRVSANNQRSLLLHRAPETLMDQSQTTISDNGRIVKNDVGGQSKMAQSFVPLVAGPLTSAELEVSKTGSPTGLMWVTLESDDANNVGFPSGTVLATSRVMDVARVPTDLARIRFLFDTNTNVSLGTTYHIVYQNDCSVSASDFTTVGGLSADSYANGRANEFRIPTSTWSRCTDNSGPSDFYFKTFVKGTASTPLVLPGAYDQYALISYVYNDSNSDLKNYVQLNRKISCGVATEWRAFSALTGLIEAVDLTAFIPPVVCSVQFHLQTAHASPNTHSPIGVVSSTDMPIAQGRARGMQTANVKGTSASAASRGQAVGPYGFIVVEDQVILARMQNSNSRLYVTTIDF